MANIDVRFASVIKCASLDKVVDIETLFWRSITISEASRFDPKIFSRPYFN